MSRRPLVSSRNVRYWCSLFGMLLVLHCQLRDKKGLFCWSPQMDTGQWFLARLQMSCMYFAKAFFVQRPVIILFIVSIATASNFPSNTAVHSAIKKNLPSILFERPF